MKEAAPLPAEELERLKRRFQRERDARLEAERIAERGLRQLYDQGQNLELLEAIAVAANATTAVSEVLRFAVTKICQFKEWPIGHAYLCTRIHGVERLVSAPIWYVGGPTRVDEFRRATEATQFAPGVGLPGRVWATGKAAWIDDVVEDTNFPRAAAARAAGLRSAFGFPVLVGDEVTAVLEFFADKALEPNDEFLRVMAQIGTQLGRVVERKRAEDQLLHDASHDPLTNLPNRALFRDRVAGAIARSKRKQNYHYAVLFIDLDHFKVVNDSLGHHAGDLLLMQVAKRLFSALREVDMVANPNAFRAADDDTLARLGGDEFIVLLDDLNDPEDGLLVAERLLEALKLPFEIEGREVYTNASVGIASSATGYTSDEEVLRDADMAMYRAKSLGRARSALYDEAMHASALKRLSIESDLRRALANDEFVLHYQPIVTLGAGRVAGFEALIRWQRGGELVYPGEFIQIAEDTGLIVRIGAWVLGEACRTLKAWRDRFPEHDGVSMSVNVSPRQFAQPELVATVRRALEDNGTPPDALTIEITEGVAMDDAERTVRVLSELKDLGVHLSIDDFGTGYSSLSYLHRYPLDVLKIDRSFISKMGGDGEGYQIVHTIMALAHTLGMDVVAEGTENPAQIEHLQTLGCGYAQGYFFSRPVGTDAAVELLAAIRLPR